MPSPIYRLFRQAILQYKQVTCTYKGCYRELCRHIIGHTNDDETVLASQFGGTSGRGLASGGDWRCLYLSGVRDAKLRDGPWHAGSRRGTRQRCVDDIDLDINIHVREAQVR
jgi:hypothetical protein